MNRRRQADNSSEAFPDMARLCNPDSPGDRHENKSSRGSR
jgi:hypothetical protein